MNIVLFAHPEFLGQQSMPRFVKMLFEGLKERGHSVSIQKPLPQFYLFPFPQKLRKWLGYIDQYLVFPYRLKKTLKRLPPDTLFVFTDHALGPWVPLVKAKPNIIHCHDFLAQRSALGEFPENKTGFTGRLYQKFIRSGYRNGENFISVSYKTRDDLQQFLPSKPNLSKVVYNGLNQVCLPTPVNEARAKLTKKLAHEFGNGYLLHVGGNDWYKNRIGVIEIYNAWRAKSHTTLQLFLIGVPPSQAIMDLHAQSVYRNDIYFLTDVIDEYVRLAYSGATALLFPSLEEGFGWPIAEAMACGCVVITTNQPPMSEVAGEAAFLIRRKPSNEKDLAGWANEAAVVVGEVVNLSPEKRSAAVESGIKNANRFDTHYALDCIEKIYMEVLGGYNLTDPKV